MLSRADDQRLKIAQLDELAASIGSLVDAASLGSALRIELRNATTTRLKLTAAEGVLRAVGQQVSANRLPLVLLEVATGTSWPRGVSWVISKQQACAEALAFLSEDVDLGLETIQTVVDAHKIALKRLNRASVSTGTKVALATGAVTVSAISYGTLAPVIGTAIGGAMGLSGAAATSAGLAFLGGGSLASGGFGMAGGILLIHVAAGAGYKGSRFLATSLASESRAAFMNELAKLHVAYRFCAADDEASEILTTLRAIADDLEIDRRTARDNATDSRARLMQNWRNFGAIKTAVSDERVAERLAAARRAVLAEVRYLSEPTWRRHGKNATKALLLLHPSDLLDVLQH
jgi:hypothetical protein